MFRMEKMNKSELISVLIDEYGYDKSDLKGSDGKPLTNPKLRDLIVQEQADAEASKVKETIIKAKEVQIKDDDLIVVMNGLNGSLVHRSSATGRVWKFNKFGQTDKIPYSEILRIRNVNSKVFDEGWLVILNEQIQDDFRLTDIYKNILTPETIDSVFNKNIEELEAFVRALPQGMKVTFVGKARELYQTKKLDSVRVIDFVESDFGISLEDNAPLPDVAVHSKNKN